MPSKIRYETLHDLAILCDKYDCVGIVQPWYEGWLKLDQIYPSKPLNQRRESVLFIAWVFGLHDVFESTAINLVQYIRTNDEGLFWGYSGFSNWDPMPPHIVGKHALITFDHAQKAYFIQRKYSETTIEGSQISAGDAGAMHHRDIRDRGFIQASM